MCPNLDRIPATARKNQVATVLSVQDYSQLEDKYGDKKAEVVTSVLSNHFFGILKIHKQQNGSAAYTASMMNNLLPSPKVRVVVIAGEE